MKITKFLGIATALMLSAFAFSSCNSDDDPDAPTAIQTLVQYQWTDDLTQVADVYVSYTNFIGRQQRAQVSENFWNRTDISMMFPAINNYQLEIVPREMEYMKDTYDLEVLQQYQAVAMWGGNPHELLPFKPETVLFSRKGVPASEMKSTLTLLSNMLKSTSVGAKFALTADGKVEIVKD